MKTTNKKSGDFVKNLKEFKASNLSGIKEGDFYIVYSYGWYPLFVYIYSKNKWIENSERYNVSTSKQRMQCHPKVNTIELTHNEIKDLLNGAI